MATPAYIAGNLVGVTYNGDAMFATKADYTRQVNVVKMTNARSGGFAEKVGGIQEASGTVECVVNGDDVIDIEEGTEATLTWSPTGGTPKSFTALVTKVKESFVIDGDYTYNFDWESSGSF
jgi:hypothetical protein